MIVISKISIVRVQIGQSTCHRVFIKVQIHLVAKRVAKRVHLVAKQAISVLKTHQILLLKTIIQIYSVVIIY